MLRSARWYAFINIPVFVGDSSRWASFVEIGNLPAEVRANTRYQHYIDGSNEIQASWKVAQVVTTPYIAWAGDDDLFLRNALVRAVYELDEDSQLTSVRGIPVIFATKNNHVWGSVESVLHYPGDAFFRVFRRDILLEAWAQTKDIPDLVPHGQSGYGDQRGRELYRVLDQLDTHRVYVDELMVMRQVHPRRVTVPRDYREPWRARLGHTFPWVQYMKQWLESWCWHQWSGGPCLDCQLMLPSLLSKRSIFHDDFDVFKMFLENSLTG